MSRVRIVPVLVALLGAAAPCAAQEAAPATSAPAAHAPAPAPPPSVSIEQAYKREYAFLEAQKRELVARIAEVRRQFDADRARLEGEVGALERRALAAKSETEALSDELVRTEQAAQANADNADMLVATFDQARATLDALGDSTLSSDAFAAQDEASKLTTLFDAAARRLGTLGQVRRVPGKYFLTDGTEVDGTLIHYGNIATYGVSPQGSGALAPAGGGSFRLWNAPAEASAQALAQGTLPATLQAYLYENANTAVSEPERKTFWGEMQKGGGIGYVIMVLGALALLLAALRAVFLHRAGASVDRIMERITPLVRQHRIPDAIEACKQFKGSAARVVTATLRNIEREREHLEDIVSESILHESTHLNRFGSFITLIAGVAPLLGLLGTVTGMIQTFDVITEFGTSDPKLLSGGIAVALVTTEQGLMVAIPCLLIGNLLNGWAERIKDDMEKAALKVVNLYQDTQLRVIQKAAA
jgi:biopolymer transport protein ExbB